MSALLANWNIPANNYISQYIKWACNQSDAYPDWHFVLALEQLAIAADKKFILRLKQGDIYPNLWIMGLGDSTVSRKSTSMSHGVGVLTSIKTPFNRLPGSFTPEALFDALSGYNHSYFFKDEAGQLLSDIKRKSYMEALRDDFCNLYECQPITRKLMK